jgi:hypothetical protein
MFSSNVEASVVEERRRWQHYIVGGCEAQQPHPSRLVEGERSRSEGEQVREIKHYRSVMGASDEVAIMILGDLNDSSHCNAAFALKLTTRLSWPHREKLTIPTMQC